MRSSTSSWNARIGVNTSSPLAASYLFNLKATRPCPLPT